MPRNERTLPRLNPPWLNPPVRSLGEGEDLNDGLLRVHREGRDSDLEKLKRIAARAGFIQKRGAQKGEGSIRQLLEALIEEKAVVAHTEEQSLRTEVERKDVALQEQLLAKGLLNEIKPLSQRNLTPFNPIQVEGEPISQMILRTRR